MAAMAAAGEGKGLSKKRRTEEAEGKAKGGEGVKNVVASKEKGKEAKKGKKGKVGKESTSAGGGGKGSVDDGEKAAAKDEGVLKVEKTKGKKRKASDASNGASPDAAAAAAGNGASAAGGSHAGAENGAGVGSGEEKKGKKKGKGEKKGKEGHKAGAKQEDAPAGKAAATSAATSAAPAVTSSGGKTVKWGGAFMVQTQGEGVGSRDEDWPTGLSSFEPLGKEGQLPQTLMQSVSAFDKPSPIQAWSWPVLLPALAAAQQQRSHGSTKGSAANSTTNGARTSSALKRDLIGIAATGSGKTLAFGIPALQHALQLRAEGGGGGGKGKGKGGAGAGAGGVPSPCVLVLAPTRELAQQIAEVLEGAGKPCGLGCVCLYGGASKGPQKGALRQHPAVVVATPGRLEDLAGEGALSLSNVTYAVLDEADRMLDLGFEPHIRAILAQTSPDRQTVMFSATWPTSVAKLAQDFLRRPVQVKVSAGDQMESNPSGGPSANRSVKQIVEVVEGRAKDSRLLTLLQEYHKSRKNRVLVFVLYKKEAQRVETFLNSRGWACGALHGDKGQADRMRAVAGFKDASVPLLVATDVAARGLDIPDVECVINYTFPLTTEDYVHRIGRTGRAGRTGTAHTLFTVADKLRAGELVNVLREAGQAVPEDLLKFGTAVKKKESKLYGAHFRDIGMDSAKPTKVTFADSDDE